jgi:carboxylesterase type B
VFGNQYSYYWSGNLEAQKVHFTKKTQKVSGLMQGAWAAFSANGDPSTAAVQWPPTTANPSGITGEAMSFGPNKLFRGYQDKQCRFWESTPIWPHL